MEKSCSTCKGSIFCYEQKMTCSWYEKITEFEINSRIDIILAKIYNNSENDSKMRDLRNFNLKKLESMKKELQNGK